MDLGQIECELYSIARTSGCTCIYSSCDIELIDGEVQIYFSTKHFVDIDPCIDYRLRRGLDEQLLVVDILRTDTKYNILVDEAACDQLVCLYLGNLDGVRTEHQKYICAGLYYLAVDEVHRRHTHETCYEEVCRVIVQILRSINLLDDTILHNNNSITHNHSFLLVMCYKYKCDT